MTTKIYNTKGITYFYSTSSKKWEFKLDEINTTFLTPLPGRAEMGAKVASILAGSVARAKAIDGLARSNISRIVGQ